MLNWWEKWGLHPDVCPCDVHFNEWVDAHGISNKAIYHFGTGTHHVIGRRQAELGTGNVVVGITASKGEFEDYVQLVIDNPSIAKSYVTYFGDIYLTNPRMLSEFDVVNLFHLCEFSTDQTVSPEYGGVDDRQLLEIFTAKTRPGGHLLFYTGSRDFEKAQPIIAAWAKERPVTRLDDFKTLMVYRKSE